MWTRSCVTVVATAVLVLSGCQQVSEPPESPELLESGETEVVEPQTSLFDLEVGTCLNDADTPLAADLTEVPTVPCDQPHDSELYAIVNVEEGIYPGVDDLEQAGRTKCQTVFTDFVGIDFRSSTLDFHFYYPTPSSWAQGDRSIFCLVSDPGLTVAGTLQGARR